MTDPTADGWTLPEDLYAGPIPLFTDKDGSRLTLGAYDDGEHVLVLTEFNDGASTWVTTDDLLTITARLTQLTHAINPPTHDPDAEEWHVVGSNGWVSRRYVLAKAGGRAVAYDAIAPHRAPHRVVHVSELGG